MLRLLDHVHEVRLENVTLQLDDRPDDLGISRSTGSIIGHTSSSQDILAAVGTLPSRSGLGPALQPVTEPTYRTQPRALPGLLHTGSGSSSSNRASLYDLLHSFSSGSWLGASCQTSTIRSGSSGSGSSTSGGASGSVDSEEPSGLSKHEGMLGNQQQLRGVGTACLPALIPPAWSVLRGLQSYNDRQYDSAIPKMTVRLLPSHVFEGFFIAAFRKDPGARLG